MNTSKRENFHNVEDILSLTPMQEGILYHYLHDPDSPQYFEQLLLEFRTHIDVKVFLKSWNHVIQVNQLLRTIFRWKKIERPVQIILQEQELQFTFTDMSHFTEAAKEEQVKKISLLDRQRSFELEVKPPFRIHLYKMSEIKYFVLLSYHHIILDGWSTAIILQEFLEAYNRILQGLAIEISPKQVFKNYLKWLKSRDMEQDLIFWKEYLADFETNTLLPEDSSIPLVNPGEVTVDGMGSREILWDQPLSNSMENLAKRLNITLTDIVNTAWGILLQRYNNCFDVLFGLTVSGRPVEILNIEKMVGLFINTIPLRIKTDTDQTISQLLKEVHKNSQQLHDHTYTPLVEIQKVSPLASQEKLFESLLVFENYPLEQLDSFPGLQIESYQSIELTNYQLTLIFSPGAYPGLKVKWLYNLDLVSTATINRLNQILENIVSKMPNSLDRRITELDILTIEEKRQILYSFNQQTEEILKSKPIPKLWKEQVEKYSDAQALVYQNTIISYKELDIMVEKLASVLKDWGVTNETIVGIITEPSLEMIVGILGILTAGGAYLPIHPDYPVERIDYILHDSSAKILLYQEQFISLVEDLAIEHLMGFTIPRESIFSETEKFNVHKKFINSVIISCRDAKFEQKTNLANPRIDQVHCEPRDLAYVIYTSGSTGRPKGVLVEHGSLSNLLSNMQREFPVAPGDTYLLKTNFTFDVSLTEIFGWILGGARLAILEPEGEKDPQKIVDRIRDYQVTHLNLVPAMYNLFMDYLEDNDVARIKSLKYLMVAGEAILKEQVRRFYQLTQGIEFINLYGPTEATIYATKFDLSHFEKYRTVPIGDGLVNLQIFVVNQAMTLQPIGFWGELCIAGIGLARGYVNEPKLTSEKFITNPFKSSGKMYRTGDLVRWLPDGNLEYYGRLDNQVKIRGYRIETGEIENQLLQHPLVKEVIVTDRIASDGNKYLCCYLLLSKTSAARVLEKNRLLDELREFLRKTLPEYMIPTHFVFLDQFPLLANGKTDRQALPEPLELINQVEYVAPKNEIEIKLIAIWQDILEIDRIGILDDFFKLGGHSLKAVRVVARIQRELEVEISVKDFFDNPTVEELSKTLMDQQKFTFQQITVQPEKEYYPISSVQKRLYLLQQMNPDNTVYNMPISLEITGKLDLNRFTETLCQLIDRHQVLRTQFVQLNGRIYQQVLTKVEFVIQNMEIDVDMDLTGYVKNFVQPFNLGKAPLLRGEMLSLSQDKHLFLLDIHHIISDGVSFDIFVREFSQLYAKQELPALRIQYRDFAEWQEELLTTGQLTDQENFWLQELSGEIPQLNLPTDYQRPAVQNFKGNRYQFSIEREMFDSLKDLINDQGITLYMLILALYHLFLTKYSDQEEIIIGTPGVGRSHPDTDKLMGMFVNTLALRLTTHSERIFIEYLAEVREKVMTAMANQDYPFELLIEKLNVQRDLSKNPLFATMFVLEDNVRRSKYLTAAGLEFHFQPISHPVAKFDLMLTAEEFGDTLNLSFEYATALFKHETIVRMSRYFKQLMINVLENPQAKLKDLEALSQWDKDQLLFEFNDTQVEYPDYMTIHQVFQNQVIHNSEKIAVSYQDQKLTYQELNQQANQLARLLRDKGITNGCIVGLMLERSPKMIVAILGILKAGGVYLPIERDWPEERKSFIFKDTNLHVLVTDSSQRVEKNVLENDGVIKQSMSINEPDIDLIDIDEDGEWTVYDWDNLPEFSTNDNLAYIIYTSGSTGTPKGVMVPHQGVIRLVCNPNYVEFCSDERITQIASCSFDASVFEIWASLLNAGQLIMISKDIVLDIVKLSQTIKESAVTTCLLTTALFNQVIDKAPGGLAALKNLLIGGEALSVPHIRKALRVLPKVRLINAYGPTENSVLTCCYSIRELTDGISSIPIGKPINNTRVYILNKNLRLVPVGAIGEIYIAGDGLAKGYFNRDELTQESFISGSLLPGEILYKSGDLGRYLPDGGIEFMGRLDYQVKVRGFRIELGEIETVLGEHPKVSDVVVLVKTDSQGVKELVAYITTPDELTIPELRHYLSAILPEYMIPNRYVFLEQLPLTISGKVDRKALPDPLDVNHTGVDFAAPADQLEELICKIFAQILKVEQVGVNDSFFILGGHSLKAARMIGQISEKLQIEVPISLIFKYPVLKDFAREIKKLDHSRSKPLIRQSDGDYYPASSAQRRIFLLNEMEPETTVYNMPMALQITGNLDIFRLKQAFIQLIERHESLRTAFSFREGDLVQIVSADAKLDFRLWEEDAFSNQSDKEGGLLGFSKPFNLTQTPLFKVDLTQQSAEEFLLIMDFHHIIADGVSMEILVNELTKLYAGENLPNVKFQYRDFVAWQSELFESSGFKAQEDYWLDQFAGEIPVLNLPLDRARPQIQNFAGDSVEVTIDRAFTSKIRELAEQQGVTVFMLLLAIYKLLLVRYTDLEDVVVGIPISGRSHRDLAEVIGMIVNTLAIHSYPRLETNFVTYLGQIKTLILQSLENQDYPFELLVEKLELRRDLSRNPVFDTMFDFQTGILAGEGIKLQGVEIKSFPIKSQISKFDLNLTAVDKEDGIMFKMIYSTKLFNSNTIARMMDHYLNLLRAIISNPFQKLGLVPILSSEENKQLIQEFNQTARCYPTDKLIYQLFETYADIQPDKIAVAAGSKNWRYGELNQQANQLAHLLLKHGVGIEKKVGIMLNRTGEMISGVLGVLKAGAGYIPIDPLYPEERIRYLLQDSGTEVLITSSEQVSKIPQDWAGEHLVLDDLTLQLGKESTANPEIMLNGVNLAYVIYTSGSTGNPKGVMVEHRNLLNSHYSWKEQFDLDHYIPHLLQLASFSFDVFIADICRSICCGGLMVIAGDERSSLPALYSLLADYRINIVNGTPGLLLPLMDYIEQEQLELRDLRYLLIGADSWHLVDYRQLVERYHNQFIVANCYGVTEAAVDASWYIEKYNLPELDGLVPIGKPIYNVQIYILDKYLNPVPLGVVGDLYIGGDGVARGYLNRPQLTEERFIPDPFRTSSVNPGVIEHRLYKTGDLGRYLPDGNIEFLGRSDNQVKIRGYRIELGEIEAVLLKHPMVRYGVVIARKGNDDIPYLAAYFVPQIDVPIQQDLPGEPDNSILQSAQMSISHEKLTETIKENLRASLPEFMVPDILILLDNLPLTPNGKVDLQALPEYQTNAIYQPPVTRLEKALAKIWREQLGIEQVGLKDNFFHLGGHSLKAMQMLTIIYQQFAVEITLGQFFVRPTLQGLANLVDQAKPIDYQQIQPLEEREYYPVSSAQNRLFFLYQFEPDSLNYNMPAVLEIQGNLDTPRLNKIFQQIINIHESLRTSFKLVKGEVVQKIHPDLAFELWEREIQPSVEVIKREITQFIRPFDLTCEPLFRSKLFRLGKERYLLLLDMHHIISDAVSMDIIIHDLIRGYDGQKLTPPAIQYRHFAVWQQRWLTTGRFKEQERFWLQEFAGEIPVLNLLTDYPRPRVQNHQGNNWHFLLEEELVSELKGLANHNNATLYMIMLTIYNILLARYTGQEEIIIGSPIAGRSHPEVQNVVGMFVNTLAIKNYPEFGKTFNSFLKEVKDKTLKVFENQDYQFEMLVDNLKLERDLGRNPLFDTVFVLQNTETAGREIKLPGITFNDYLFEHLIAKFDLTLLAVEKEGQINCTFNYCTKLFKESTVQRMAGHYKNIIRNIISSPSRVLGSIDLLSSGEKRSLLIDFNRTPASYPERMTIDQIFAEQVTRFAENIAVVGGEEQITYNRLLTRANQIAELLQRIGVVADTLVGLMIERSLEMVVSILGILRAGGAYVPLDPDYPLERLSYMLEDSGVKILITQSSLREQIPENFSGEIVYLDQISWDTGDKNPKRAAKADNLAYIIYTSGSTGKPKGMMIEHRNVVRLFKSTPTNFDFDSEDIWTLFHSYCFDFSVWEIFGALLFGGKLIIVDQKTRINTEAFLMLCKREKVTVLNQTPAAFYNFIEMEKMSQEHSLNQHLRYVIFGGEALNFRKLNPWMEIYDPDEIKLINMYGITETTVHVTYKRISTEDISDTNRSLIGRPIYTTTLYLFDKMGNLVPPGVPGEIYVGGLGLGRGYLHRPELTKEKFITAPFDSAKRLYRSGDLGRFLEDGTLEYLGRIDHQLKIRGFRIEIGEIEANILQYPEIQDVIVIERFDQYQQNYLVGYLVIKEENSATFKLQSLQEYLGQKLPEYMIPTTFMLLDCLPLTSNGKVNHKALPEPDFGSNLKEYIAPRNKLEERLAGIWQQVLGRERIGVTDNFFTIGGNSLSLMKVFSELREAFPEMELTITDLFKYNSISAISEFICTRLEVVDDSQNEVTDDEIEEFIM